MLFSLRVLGAGKTSCCAPWVCECCLRVVISERGNNSSFRLSHEQLPVVLQAAVTSHFLPCHGDLILSPVISRWRMGGCRQHRLLHLHPTFNHPTHLQGSRPRVDLNELGFHVSYVKTWMELCKVTSETPLLGVTPFPLLQRICAPCLPSARDWRTIPSHVTETRVVQSED